MNVSAPTAAQATPDRASRGAHAERGAALSSGRFYLWLALGALALAGLSLLLPSTPSYDPWSWLIWGHEIIHLDLHTAGGSTWKPLPAIFTTVFALFGGAQPFLWLVVARAGAIVACVMVFKLSARIVWWLRDQATGAGPQSTLGGEPGSSASGNGSAVPRASGSATNLELLGALAPSLLAGAIAIIGLGLSGGFAASSALGYSEGLMVAAVLIAVERHLDGHRHQAFMLGFVAALDRPEIWLYWGPYGLWLMWKDPSARALVVGLAALTLFLWFVPQYWGSGSFTSGVARAQRPRSNSAAFASCPFCAELHRHAWPQVLFRIKVAGGLAVCVAMVGLARLWHARPGFLQWRLWRADPGIKFASERERALFVLVLCGVFGLSWWVLVALETQAGFSGNDRYLVLGSAFIDLAGGVGFGWAAVALVRLSRRHRAADGARRVSAATTAVAAIASAAVFLLVPNWIGHGLINIPATHGSLVYQADLRQDVLASIQRAGGAKRVLACGSVMSEDFQVPMVAYDLDVHILRIEATPAVNRRGVSIPPVPWPNVIVQVRDTRNAGLQPLPQTVLAWEHAGARYTMTRDGTVHFFEDCRK